jgi:hypothetical protein
VVEILKPMAVDSTAAIFHSFPAKIATIFLWIGEKILIIPAFLAA